MKTCSECQGRMGELTAKTPEGISYSYHRCSKCGEEVVDMKQLHNVAEKYREMKKYHVKLSKWGLSIGLRIPKEIAKKYHLKDNKEVALVAEDSSIRIIPYS